METSISRFLETAKHFKELIDQSEKRLKRMKELDKLSQRINKQDLYGKTPPGQLTPPNETILSDVFDRINAKLPGQAREVEQFKNIFEEPRSSLSVLSVKEQILNAILAF